MICILKFISRNSVKSVGGVMVLVLCKLSDNALYVYNASRKCFEGFLRNRPEPSCSKLTASLVNVSLKFQT